MLKYIELSFIRIKNVNKQHVSAPYGWNIKNVMLVWILKHEERESFA
jgi:hypothetical protein